MKIHKDFFFWYDSYGNLDLHIITTPKKKKKKKIQSMTLGKTEYNSRIKVTVKIVENPIVHHKSN